MNVLQGKFDSSAFRVIDDDQFAADPRVIDLQRFLDIHQGREDDGMIYCITNTGGTPSTRAKVLKTALRGLIADAGQSKVPLEDDYGCIATLQKHLHPDFGIVISHEGAEEYLTFIASDYAGWTRKYDDAIVADATMLNGTSTDDIVLLEKLAEGIDPFTGEVLPRGHLLQHPQVVRALFHAQHAIAQKGKKSQRNPSLHANAGTAWSKAEDEDLVREFDAKISTQEIAKKHGRTKGAINSRLLRLGLISLRE